jgi:hypothetical protein
VEDESSKDDSSFVKQHDHYTIGFVHGVDFNRQANENGCAGRYCSSGSTDGVFSLGEFSILEVPYHSVCLLDDGSHDRIARFLMAIEPNVEGLRRCVIGLAMV